MRHCKRKIHKRKRNQPGAKTKTKCVNNDENVVMNRMKKKHMNQAEAQKDARLHFLDWFITEMPTCDCDCDCKSQEMALYVCLSCIYST